MFEQMRMDAICALIDKLEEGYTGDYYDLHDEVFNTDYYVESEYVAKDILGDYAFEAIGKVCDYEKSIFGTITTDLSCAASVANMLYYIIGEEVMTEIDNYYDDVDEETRKELIKKLKNLK